MVVCFPDKLFSGNAMRKTDQKSLWKEIERVLSYHQKASDPTPIHTLNRLFREHLTECKASFIIDKENCRVFIEDVGWEQADQLIQPDRVTRNPSHMGEPIVVVVYQGARYLIDGRRRVNQCVYERSQAPLTALLIEYHDDK